MILKWSENWMPFLTQETVSSDSAAKSSPVCDPLSGWRKIHVAANKIY